MGKSNRTVIAAIHAPGVVALALVAFTACGVRETIPWERRGADEIAPASPQRAAYPAGPYGYGVGDVIADEALLGFIDPAHFDKTPAERAIDTSRLRTIRLGDWYRAGRNPRAKERPRLLHVVGAALWCGCPRPDMKLNEYRAFVLAPELDLVMVILEDRVRRSASAATVRDVLGRRRESVPFAVDPIPVLAPYFDLRPGIPLNVLIDVATMTIRDRWQGCSQSRISKHIDAVRAAARP